MTQTASNNPSHWQHYAACRGMDPDLFFPPAGHVPRRAKAICESCPVTDECLAFALQHEPHRDDRFGVYGGLSAVARRQRFDGPISAGGKRAPRTACGKGHRYVEGSYELSTTGSHLCLICRGIKTYCTEGHKLTPGNSYTNGKYITCRLCAIKRQRRWQGKGA